MREAKLVVFVVVLVAVAVVVVNWNYNKAKYGRVCVAFNDAEPCRLGNSNVP